MNSRTRDQIDLCLPSDVMLDAHCQSLSNVAMLFSQFQCWLSSQGFIVSMV